MWYEVDVVNWVGLVGRGRVYIERGLIVNRFDKEEKDTLRVEFGISLQQIIDVV